MKVSRAVLREMRAAFLGRATESGGILGALDGIVCRFAFDEGQADAAEYIPDTDRLNSVLRAWCREGIVFSGMVHTHVGGCRLPSGTDTESMRTIYRAMQSDHLYFPIVTFDGEVMAITVYRIDAEGIKEDVLDTL